MSWWKRFWRLRKQNDVVKIMLLFSVLGLGFIANAVYNGMQIYKLVNEPVEYVLSGWETGSSLDSRLSELAGLENVAAVSCQIDSVAMVKYQTFESTISYVMLSEKFIESSYGIRDRGSMKTFYMNAAAYKQFTQSVYFRTAEGKNSGNVQGSSLGYVDEGLRVSYSLDGQATSNEEGSSADNQVSDTAYGTAKVVLVDTDIAGDEPYVFCKGDRASLLRSATGVRVRVGQQDLDGMNVKQMQGLGFSVVNEELIIRTEYEQEIQIIKIKFGLLLAVVCAVSIWALGKYGRIEKVR